MSVISSKASPLQPIGEQGCLDVAFAVLPTAEVDIAECISEERNHPLLGEDFPLADASHRDFPPGPVRHETGRYNHNK